MVDPQKFVDNLVEFKNKVENEEIPASNFGAIRDILADKTFTPEIINKSCPPAAALCDWVINITSYYDVTVSLEPKR